MAELTELMEHMPERPYTADEMRLACARAYDMGARAGFQEAVQAAQEVLRELGRAARQPVQGTTPPTRESRAQKDARYVEAMSGPGWSEQGKITPQAADRVVRKVAALNRLRADMPASSDTRSAGERDAGTKNHGA